MGRRADPAALQDKKGNPGKRMSRAERQAARVATMLASVPMGASVEPPPAFAEPRYAGALTIWRELGPELEKTNRLQPIHRQAFAMFCVYIAEWWWACDDVMAHGHTQRVKTTVGGVMERLRPSLRVREIAFDRAKEAAQAFGLTPREEYVLFKDQSLVARENPGLFGRPGPAPKPAPSELIEEAAPPPAPSSIGGMSAFRSEPPPRTH